MTQSPNQTPNVNTEFSARNALLTKIATYDDYAAVQAAVDLLSDMKFDVSAIDIVGHGLRSVESVQGRMTNGKAALYGAGGGAWFGLLLGILFALFMPIAWLQTLLIAIVLGALWGALFGFLGHVTTGGNRDFRSLHTIQSTSYDLLVKTSLADEAKRILARGR